MRKRKSQHKQLPDKYHRMERWKKKMEILDFGGRWRNGHSEQVLDGQIERRRERRESSGRLRVTGNVEEERGGEEGEEGGREK